MPKRAYYFPHDANAHDNPKIRMVKAEYGHAGYSWFFHMIEYLTYEDKYYFDYSDFTFKSFADIFSDSKQKCTAEEAQSFIDFCIEIKLFIKVDDTFHSNRHQRDMARWEEKIEKFSKGGKASAKARGYTFPQASENATKKMIELYEQKTGKTVNPPDVDLLNDILDNYTPEQIERAIDEAVKNNAKSPMKYIAKVLDNWGKEEVNPLGGRRTETYKRKSTSAKQLKQSTEENLR